MTLQEFLEFIETDEVLKEMFSNMCSSNVTQLDVTRANYWVRARMKGCSCQYTHDMLKKVKYVTAYRVAAQFNVDPEYDVNVVNKMCFDLMQVEGMLSTGF